MTRAGSSMSSYSIQPTPHFSHHGTVAILAVAASKPIMPMFGQPTLAVQNVVNFTVTTTPFTPVVNLSPQVTVQF